MISIIICSRQGNLPFALVQNVNTGIGCEFEWVVIDNRNNQHSITEAYNLGIAQSKFPYLVFMHDDILMHTSDWGIKLMAHLDLEDTGIVGVAGSAFVSRIPASWSAGFTHTNFIQSDRTGRKPTETRISAHPTEVLRQEMILLDGVYLAMKKTLAETLLFDAQIAGFHGYDQDISLAATVAGYRNYVVFDILIEHFSRGIPDSNYYINLNKIYRKWGNHLPLYAEGLETSIQPRLAQIEMSRLKTLRTRMLKKGVSLNEVQKTVIYWNKRCGLSVRAGYLYLTLIRLFT